mgnify:CR=1 FL=1
MFGEYLTFAFTARFFIEFYKEVQVEFEESMEEGENGIEIEKDCAKVTEAAVTNDAKESVSEADPTAQGDIVLES